MGSSWRSTKVGEGRGGGEGGWKRGQDDAESPVEEEAKPSSVLSKIVVNPLAVFYFFNILKREFVIYVSICSHYCVTKAWLITKKNFLLRFGRDRYLLASKNSCYKQGVDV